MVIIAPPAVAQTFDAARLPTGPTMNSIVARARIFRTVDPAEVALLATQLPPVHFKCRHQIYREGQPGDRLYVIASGKVKLGRRSTDDRSHLLAIAGPSDMFGELSLFDGGPRTASATALTDVSAVAMDRDVLHGWLADHPEIAERLLRVLAQRLRRTDGDLSDLTFNDVPGRVAKQLLRLAQRFGVQEGGAMRVTHDLTQEEIAQLIGSSRETVNKVLTDFTQRGWIRLDGKSVLITEPEYLVRHARQPAPGRGLADIT